MPTEPVDLVRQAADDSVARRRVALAVVATLAVFAVLNLSVLAGVVTLAWNAQQRQHADDKAGAQIIRDLYDSINRTDRSLAKLTGEPVAPPVTPPARVTSTTTVARPRLTTGAAVTVTTAVRARVATSTTTTATTAPKPAPASTSTTSTTGPRSTTTTTDCVVKVDGVVCKS